VTPAAQLANGPLPSASPGIAVHVLPLHFFIDLALIDRLLPWLRSIPPVLASTKTRAARGRPEHPAASVLDSLDAEYPAGGPRRELADAPLSPSNLHVPFLRLEIRCPAPASSLGIGDGSYLRSGILTLDLRNAVARLKPAAARLQARSASESTAATEVEWQQLEVFFLRVGETRALSFVSVGLGSAVDSHDSAADGPALLPQIQVFPALVAPIRPGPRGQQSAGAQHLVCRLPSIQIDAHKATAEGLQYFVDDITQWLNGAFGDGSRPCPKEDIRLIGSRFFGARQSSFSSSSSDDGRSSVGGRLPPGESSESLITVEIADSARFHRA
jgi:autophagy-related protein 2